MLILVVTFPQVPGLFPKDELVTIMEGLTPKAKKAGRGLSAPEIYAFFIEQCRANLHLVITMSPVGEAFRARLRKFPSLVNCCTIDWFSEWPDDALKSVASQFLKVLEMLLILFVMHCQLLLLHSHLKRTKKFLAFCTCCLAKL